MNVEGRQLLRPARREDVFTRFSEAVTNLPANFAIPLGAAAAYYVGCLMGFALRFPSSGISFFWPPNAVLITALLVVPRRWRVVLASTFVAHVIAHVQDGIPPAAWSIQFLGNASQAILAAWIIRRFGSPEIFANLRRVLVFVVGASLLAPALASVAPSFVYVSLGWAPDFFEAWRARAVSNTVATLTVVPSLLILWGYRHTPVVRPRRLAEFAAMVLGLFVADAAAAYTGRSDLLTLSIRLYAMTPILLWATVRFGGAGLSLALSTTVLIISNAAIGMSPVASGAPADAIVGVQLLLTAAAVPLMLLAGLLEERRAEQRALVDMEQQTRAILRALPDTVLLHTRDGVVQRSYPDPIDDISKASGTHAPHVPLPPDANETDVAPLDQAWGALRVTEYSDAAEGTARRYEARSVAVDDERRLTVIRDITDRWRSEQALRDTQHRFALATGVGLIGVWDLDVATGAMHVEGTLRTALGYSQEEIGDTLSDWLTIVFAADRDDVVTRLSALADGTVRTFEAEFRMNHKDGSVRWIDSYGGVTDTVDGTPTRVVGTYADVTERKESRRALREANERLMRVGRIAVIGEVTATIAHELSQPLTAMTTNAIACLRSLDADRKDAVREALNDIVQDSRRATQILDRTRGLFRHHTTQPTLLHLNDVVREVVKMATPRLGELDVQLTQALEPNLPHVYADAVQMQQVLFNLIVNGADAMSDVAGRPRQMRVSTRYGKRYVVVSVRDNGVGLDSADSARVFEPFYTTKPGGSGMGLAISRSIVQSHGGVLWSVANSDVGSTFRFKLPIPTPRARETSAHAGTS